LATDWKDDPPTGAPGRAIQAMDFDSIHNHHEQAVYEAVQDRAAQYPMLANRDDALADVACVALNRLPPRYIRHSVDFAFYLTERERAETERDVAEAVSFAFEFVQARMAMRARR
jgi:hypothetical protein